MQSPGIKSTPSGKSTPGFRSTPGHRTTPWITTRAPSGSRGLRSRLITGFLAVALLPFIGISFVLTVSGAQSGRQNVINQLETVLNYKQSSILIWGNALKAELGNILLSENVTAVATQDLQTLLLSPEPDSPANQALRDAIRGRFHLQLNQSQYYDELFILDPQGKVLLATNTGREGQSSAQTSYYHQGLIAPYLAAPAYNEAAQGTEVFVSYPIVIQGRQPVGVIVGRARITVLNNILTESTGLGQTGKTYLVSRLTVSPLSVSSSTEPGWRVLAGLNREQQGPILANLPPSLVEDDQGLSNFAGAGMEGEPVLGVTLYVPDLQAYLMGTQARAESLRATYAVLAVNVSVAISSILIGIFLALMITRSITAPLSELAEVVVAGGYTTTSAQSSRAGDLHPIEAIEGGLDPGLLEQASQRMSAFETGGEAAGESSLPYEIASLAAVFANMTSTLAGLIRSLEERVAQRTSELAKRSAYQEASAQVSQATASILDPDELIEHAVEVIQDTYNLYYVGLFLIDGSGQWAILKAGTGEAGRKMLAARHRLPLGRASMIGWSITNAQARIAQVAEEDLVRQANPDLPDTRSEAAIPLRSRGQVIGAISVQSDQPNAFDEAGLAMLQAMADQLAVAIDNARLFAQAQDSLEVERRAYATQSETAWASWLGGQPGLTYRALPGKVERSERIWYPEMQQAFRDAMTVESSKLSEVAVSEKIDTDTTMPAEAMSAASRLAVPIKVRGATIGVLNLSRSDASNASAEKGWAHEEIAFVETIAEQLAVALDSARLYTETQRRATQERLVAGLTARMRATLDIETVLKTAADELYAAFKVDDAAEANAGLESIIIELTPGAAKQREAENQEEASNV
jgi:GAF domain-containing protein